MPAEARAKVSAVVEHLRTAGMLASAIHTARV
jgi:hypothetical protein